VGLDDGAARVLRGGSSGEDAQCSRAAYRNMDDPYHYGQNIGFRPARTLAP
jgi:formylglycine-generating enzyme required for sulfatase activity